MKKHLLVIIALLVTSVLAAQQPTGEKRDGRQRIEQQIRNYISAFSLDGTKAEKFDAMYKAYSKKLYAIHNLYRHESPNDGTALSDEQLEKRILDNIAQSRAILDVREEYYKQFRTILTPSQINKIFEDEKARRAQIRATR